MPETIRSTDPATRLREWADIVGAMRDDDGRRIARRTLAEVDLAYLLIVVCGRHDLLHPWLIARCDEVQDDPDGHLDLWAREHGKSSIITFGRTLQDIARDPELTVGLFSHTRPIAKAFLSQLMRELENNPQFHELWPHVFWANPRREAPKWSEDGGIIVRRKTNPKEATIEAWGLVDGQPTGRHFRLRVYDDVVTRESVTTPDQVKKTTEALELSDNLGVAEGGRVRMIGTRYSFADTYAEVLARGVASPRIYPATHDGTLKGAPVLFSAEEWERRKRTQPTQVAAQLLQNPTAGLNTSFRPAWLRSYEIRPLIMNIAIIVDASKGNPTRRSDRTAMPVIGSDTRGNRFLLDGYCHRMDLEERWRALKQLYRKWSHAQGVQGVSVAYETYGMQTDVESLRWRMREERIDIPIEEVSTPRDHTRSKQDRYERLQPDFKTGSFFIPLVLARPAGGEEVWYLERGKDVHDDEAPVRLAYRELMGPTKAQRKAINEGRRELVIGPLKRVDEAKRAYDLTRVFIEEFLHVPFAVHDDLIDATSRIYDVEGTALPPAEVIPTEDLEPRVYSDT